MPEANRSRTAASKPAEAAPVDPRLALAQQYLKTAATDISEKEREAARTGPRRAGAAGGRGAPRAFALSISPATFAHIVLAMVVLTFAALVVLVSWHLLQFIAVGRVVALPAGVVVFAALSYLSALFLGVIESTSTGRTEVESLPGDWRDWFWTLPSTLGMLALAAFIGWFLSLGVPVNVWLLIALCVLVLYPILQLSSLETGSPLAPLSLPVLQSIVRHPIGWFMLYAVSFALANLLWAAARLAWNDPPYSTVLIMGPLVTLALFLYAWLLGQLAQLISTEKESS